MSLSKKVVLEQGDKADGRLVGKAVKTKRRTTRSRKK
jgi:hypothetical protein